MNVIDLFKREIVRPLVTLAIPGAVAVLPYFYLLFFSPKFIVVWTDNRDWIFFLLIVSFLAVGLILEDIGSQIEIGIRKLFNDDSGEIWEKYINLESKTESVAQTYIGTIVLRLKFELGMATAIACAIPGILKILSLNCIDNQLWIVLLLLIAYLIVEAIFSIDVLHKTRKSIVTKETVSSSEKELESFTINNSEGETILTGKLKFAQPTTQPTTQPPIDATAQLEKAIEKAKSITVIVAFIMVVATFVGWLGFPNWIKFLIPVIFVPLAFKLFPKLINSENQTRTINLGNSTINFLVVAIFSLVFLLGFKPIIDDFNIPYICINSPLVSQFNKEKEIVFEGNVSNSIDYINAYVTQLDHNLANIPLVTKSEVDDNNKWSFTSSFNQSGERNIIVKGLNKNDKVVAEKTVKIKITD